MSILAEPRRKQRITVDPQNITWKQDNFGKSLLQKMGWSDGKGLGANEQGSSENLKLKANFTSTGLGCDKVDNDGQWIAHHDDFASLLQQLNSKGSDSEKKPSAVEGEVSIQMTSKNQRKRIHYKFTRGKDLTLASTLHKDGIFGKNRHSKRSDASGDVNAEQSAQMSSPLKDKEVEKEEVSDEKKEPLFASQLITVSTSSVADLYKEKMKKWQNRGIMGTAVFVDKKIEYTEVKEEVSVEAFNENNNVETAEKKAERKRLKKERKRLAALAAEADETTYSLEADEDIKVETPEEKAERKRLKRERKRLEAEAIPVEAAEDDAEREERRRLRREKKAKKALESNEELNEYPNAEEPQTEEPVKKRKKLD